MCGISGIVNSSGITVHLPHEIKIMSQAIKHRGPDGEGFVFFNEEKFLSAGSDDTPVLVKGSAFPYSPQKHIDEVENSFNVALGHRRLSIIDLSPAGHQPMCTNDHKLWITYNGEIYNYIELKNELQQLGCVFQTASDTEVILQAYRYWGKDCLEHFNGMWAFVIFDVQKQELFGARDRFGVKPLYYYRDNHFFAFASEQKALVKSKCVNTSVNPAALFDYLVKGETELEEEGMFKNIMELFPSFAFTFNIQSGDFKKWKYYTLPVNNVYEPFDGKKFSMAGEKVRSILVNAIDIRLRSDVTVGSCLSGGIDSSAIVGIINHLLSHNAKINIGDKLKVFTAVFPQTEFDESRWAGLMADKTGADWHKTTPREEDLLQDFSNLIYSQDEPIWSTSTYAQYRVMRLAKENNIKVVLDGQGGDELFGGYDTYYLPYWQELLNKAGPSVFFTELKSFGGLGKGIGFFLRQYLRLHLIHKLPLTLKASIYQNYFKEIQYLNRDFWETYKHRLNNNTPPSKNLNDILYSEFYNSRLKVYLKCEDRCSMWHSVESRTPFADDKQLIEYAFQLPSSFKIHKGVRKSILRDAISPFVPAEVRNRKDKMGYSTPHKQWVNNLAPQFSELFTQDVKEYLRVDELKRQYSSVFRRDKPENSLAFKFVCFSQWKKAFNL